MKAFLQTLFSALLFALILSSCASRGKSAYAPVIPPPTFQVDPALLDSPASTGTPPAESEKTEAQKTNAEKPVTQ